MAVVEGVVFNAIAGGWSETGVAFGVLLEQPVIREAAMSASGNRICFFMDFSPCCAVE